MGKDSYYIRVNVIEARNLKGTDKSAGYSCNPVCRIDFQAAEGPQAIRRTLYTATHKSTNSVYFGETKIFQEKMSREEFETARIVVSVEDDRLFFANNLVGNTQFELKTIHDHPDHEIYGQWIALINESKGVGVQGFLRLSVVVLKEGEQPKIHGRDDLDADEEGDMSLVMGLPQIETTAYLLTLRIYKVEIAKYGLSLPDPRVRCRYGTVEQMTHIEDNTFTPRFNDELRLAVVLPTLTDRIRVEVVDASRDNMLLCEYILSFKEVMADPVECQWFNMYGSRPSVSNPLAKAFEKRDDSGMRTAYRGRILLYASAEQEPKPKSQRLPMMISMEEVDALAPKVLEYGLRCDVYEGTGFNLGGFDSVFIVASLGPVERRSAARRPTDGMIRFESPADGKEGYYEQLEEIRAKMPQDVTQHYDIFLHVYVSNAVGERRVGYKRYQTRQLLEDRWNKGPQWVLLEADPVAKDEMPIASAMIQIALQFGTVKSISQLPRMQVRLPKLKQYELTANIYQAENLQPADANGLADPYVKIALAGVTKESKLIPASLNPIWYEPISLRVSLPGDLTLAPKIQVMVYDSDPPPLSIPLLRDAPNLLPGADWGDTCIARALAPPNSVEDTIQQYYVSRTQRTHHHMDPSKKLIWLDLYDPLETEILDFEPGGDDDPVRVGGLLCSFEIRSMQEVKVEEQAAKNEAHLVTSLVPETDMRLVEIAVVGVRDMQPREIFGIPIEITMPYVEFEYGDRTAEERVWRTKIVSANNDSNTLSNGPNANFLETMYIRVALPKDYIFRPMMGVRVRESARPFGPISGLFGEDPILGITSINLLEEMPEYRAEMEKKNKQAQLDAQKNAEESERKLKQQVKLAQAERPAGVNEVVMPEIFLSAAARSGTRSRGVFGANKGGATKPGMGERNIEEPEVQEIAEEDDDDSDDAEKEDAEETLKRPIEEDLDDIPFKMYNLETKMEKKEDKQGVDKLISSAGINLGPKQKSAGLLKMKVRVIRESEAKQFLKENPPLQLRKLYAERITKVRLFIYYATGLTPRQGGAPPQPFLKVYNSNRVENIRTTRDTNVGTTLEPEFYSAFELTAVLPGQSRLHVEVWDYQVLKETQIGGTTIDLEDRLFSKKWIKMHEEGKLPRETRILEKPADSSPQGAITLKVDILDRKFALANPMEELLPPQKDMYELRVIVWEATEVALKDDGLFGGEGKSDVFVTITPRGSDEYEQQHTDTHFFSTGDAEFNWRMVWPIALPEKSPRLFLQVWDYDLIGANDAIGEAQLNLKALCEKAQKRGGSVRQESVWIPCTHPNFKEVQARVRLTMELVSRADAIMRPAGKGRGPPNMHPYLPEPVRPNFFDGLGINLNFLNPFYLLKKYRLCCCGCCICLIVAVIIFLQVSG
ncbi:hypothetical protein AB1Y20_014132 [Prymnesium parvum]|uniref:C2 domain-containing protein n=1 Tax=Prymnesium parvum TaxID=97485 RepID=A0AB34IHM8_PRYPA